MLRLSSEQIDGMNRMGADRSAAILAQLLREEIPDRVGHMNDEELLALTRRTSEEARASGLYRNEDIDLYVYARMYLGISFPGERPDLHATLSNHRLDWEDRARALAEAMSEADR